MKVNTCSTFSTSSSQTEQEINPHVRNQKDYLFNRTKSRQHTKCLQVYPIGWGQIRPRSYLPKQTTLNPHLRLYVYYLFRRVHTKQTCIREVFSLYSRLLYTADNFSQVLQVSRYLGFSFFRFQFSGTYIYYTSIPYHTSIR
jgi:hypothetical protein